MIDEEISFTAFILQTYNFLHLLQNMTKLSVNINKVATIRNARGGDVPNVVEIAINCQKFGADGVTIHPRPDERHISRKDVFDIKPIITTEFNIEGFPSEDFIKMVLEVKPDQVTLVPDTPDVITSCSGWDTIKFQDYLYRFKPFTRRYFK